MASSKTGSFWNSDLGQRIPSAIVMLIAIIGISYLGGMPLLIVSVLLSGLLFYEWYLIVRNSAPDANSIGVCGAFALAMLLILFGYNAVALIILVLAILVVHLVNSGGERVQATWLAFGGLYASIPAFTFLLVRGDQSISSGGSFALLMFLYLTVWATDIFAYFSGRAFGGPKLLPVVSPKKTWSGALGGLFSAMIVGMIYMIYVEGFAGFSTVVLAAILSVVSQIGDLFESWVKRHFQVKDSSQLIPGHGGFLDRVDGLIAAAVPVGIYLVLTS